MSGEHPSSAHRHRHHAPRSVPAVVITVSDTRTLEDDTGGALLAELLEGGGHQVLARVIVADEIEAIRKAVDEAIMRADVRAVLLTGGTGIAARDVTPEAIQPILDRPLPGFGELFRQLSYEEIGSAAMLSRALAGTARGRVLFALPGSRAAIRLALEKLVLPELGHLAAEAAKGR
ncbi:MAG: MogA/MoaB family molybdenum cofactor biosynthesis protein [Myxococcota bacterium]|nr:MogA/MoaB family molybdenum cofactor biosynthesis protein [Myxococcota bacterium]